MCIYCMNIDYVRKDVYGEKRIVGKVFVFTYTVREGFQKIGAKHLVFVCKYFAFSKRKCGRKKPCLTLKMIFSVLQIINLGKFLKCCAKILYISRTKVLSDTVNIRNNIVLTFYIFTAFSINEKYEYSVKFLHI